MPKIEASEIRLGFLDVEEPHSGGACRLGIQILDISLNPKPYFFFFFFLGGGGGLTFP